MILTIRTDKPVSELGLYSPDGSKLGYMKWEAHRNLSSTILGKIKDLLEAQGTSYSALSAVVFYEGPGSFTGLRIGASVANTLAYGLEIPVCSIGGERWISEGIVKLEAGNGGLAVPFYGSEPHVTPQKK